MKFSLSFLTAITLLHNLASAAPVVPVLLGLGVGAGTTGGLSCMVVFDGSGCKGEQRRKAEEKRQKDIQIGNLQNLDKLNKDDTQFKIDTTSTINYNNLENSDLFNQVNMAHANANSELATTFNDGQKVELNQNLELSSALRSKVVDGSANRLKKLTDLSSSLDAPVNLSKGQIDQMFAS